MSRKGATFLLAGLTLAATTLVPHAAAATEAKPRTTDGRSIQLPMSQSEGASSERTRPKLVGPNGREVPPVGGLKGLISCPEGYHPSPFDMPIYDEDGLFVIGHETVWICIPDDLEPAG